MSAPSIAEIFIEQELVRVELEIGGRNAGVWRALLAEEGAEMERLVEVLPLPLRRGLVVRAGRTHLESHLRHLEIRPRVSRDRVTGEALPVAEDAEKVLFLVHEYPFAGRPDILVFGRPFEEARLEIGFIAYHQGLPISDFRYFPGPTAARLNWDDPWYSRFLHPNLRRQYDSPLSTYLYLEPYEVRHEVVVRPVDLENWIDLGLAGRSTIPVDMQPEIQRRAARFLAESSTLTVDGQPVVPTLERVHFLRRTLRRSTVVDPPEELDMASAILGVIFTYPISELPQEAAVHWELFSPRIRKVPAAISDPVTGPVPYMLMPGYKVLTWHNFLEVPVLPGLTEVRLPPRPPWRAFTVAGWLCGLALAILVIRWIAGALSGSAPSRRAVAAAAVLLAATTFSGVSAQTGRVDGETSEEILRGLLHNVYLSFAYRDESTIYDALEQSMTGELLAQTYLETQRGLVLESQGGARVKVKEVELLHAEGENLPDEVGLLARATWNVTGSVGHWGHIHKRTNQYQAELTVKAVDGVWKITRLDLLQEERL